MSTPNLSAEIVLKWGDGKYLFALKGKQIEHLEKVCGGGIQEIAERLFNRRSRYTDIRKIIELGLEGGGMPPVEVADVMQRFFDGQPLANPADPSSPLATAQAVIAAAFYGMEDVSQPGEADAGSAPAPEQTSPVSEPHS